MTPANLLKKYKWQVGLIIGKAKHNWISKKNFRNLRGLLISLGYTPDDIEYVYSQEQLEQPITQKDIDTAGEVLLTRLLMRDYPNASINNKPITENYLDEVLVYAPTVINASAEEAKEIKVELVSSDKQVESDIYSAKCLKQTAELHPKQSEAAFKIIDKFFSGRNALMLIGGAGVGKTYVAGSVINNFHNLRYFDNKTITPWKVLYVTKASIVIQTKRVLRDEFGLDPVNDFHIVNIEQLRSSLGVIYLQEKVVVIDGEPRTEWIWRPLLHPLLFIWDECHILKNEHSEQSKIGLAATRLSSPYIRHIFMSATPVFRISEARAFVCACKVKRELGGVVTTINDENWPQYARIIAAPADPYEYCKAAIDRLMDDMDDNIIRMKNVRPKFHAKNAILRIAFDSAEDRKRYDTAYERFQAKKLKIEGLDYLSKSQSRMAVLAQMNKFAEEAEVIRARWLARQCVDVWKRDKAPGFVLRFKRTINTMCWELINVHGWDRSDISLVWGGNIKQTDTKKDKARSIMSNELLMKELRRAGISLEDLGLDFTDEELAFKSPEEIAFEKENNLGAQNPQQRQKEIDRYMKQKSRVAIVTYKSGGVGLSLHHKYPHTFPREVYLTPVYSGVELVQGFGRFPRLTSLSDTEQFMVYYGNTIEDHVMARVSSKLGCLTQVVRQRESWEDIIIGKSKHIFGQGGDEEDTKLLDDNNEDNETSDTYIEGDE